MNTSTNVLTNSCHGWHFKYVERLSETQELKIVTTRTHGGQIVTRASVFNNSAHFPGKDWSDFIIRTNAKGTRENVVTQHTKALTYLPQIRACVVKHDQPAQEVPCHTY
jgi:hypothetical protein